ncbi:MAG: OmpA family protein [Hyphomonadaceae bacterium]|nr:MAG: peptidoglycan-associated lipoprotein [Caulobacteraceae bacterium]MBT9447683.1 OmpA family protein [Hyphomonadaceae bacterium]TPW06795.1 MAG: peptidoglycan-associated lipoprotein [Alphaproteobacteria bacterium]
MRIIAKVAAFALIAAMAACASKPAVVETPAPTPAVQAPVAPVAPRPTGPAPGSLDDFRVTVGERVFFGYDRFDLSPEARATLEKQAAWLRRYGTVRVLIAGSADERGTREYNLALGARRAASAKEYLVGLGVPANRVETVSYGKERPLDPRSSDEAHALNRNAHTQLVSGAVS